MYTVMWKSMRGDYKPLSKTFATRPEAEKAAHELEAKSRNNGCFISTRIEFAVIADSAPKQDNNKYILLKR